jgi:hypothetical protein
LRQSRIIAPWGIFATLMAAVAGESSFYIVRFLLGAPRRAFFRR